MSWKAINGNTIGHDFLVFYSAEKSEICFCHLNGNSEIELKRT